MLESVLKGSGVVFKYSLLKPIEFNTSASFFIFLSSILEFVKTYESWYSKSHSICSASIIFLILQIASSFASR